jgi:hypothetical protein
LLFENNSIFSYIFSCFSKLFKERYYGTKIQTAFRPPAGSHLSEHRGWDQQTADRAGIMRSVQSQPADGQTFSFFIGRKRIH